MLLTRQVRDGDKLEIPTSSHASCVNSYPKGECQNAEISDEGSADIVAYADGEKHKLVVEFAIPGLAIGYHRCEDPGRQRHLIPPARDIEYVAALALGWPVKPDKAEATYENGLLRIEVPFKDPMEDAVKVAIKTGAETKPKTIVTGGELPAVVCVSGKAPAGQQSKSPVATPA